MYTPSSNTPYVEPNIFVKNVRLDVVDSFIYLGSTLARDGSLDAEILLRVFKATKSFGALESRVWSDRDLTTNTKISVYQSCVLAALLYSSETWTTYRRHIKVLERVHQKFLRRIMNIKWDTFTPDTQVLDKAKVKSIESLVIRNQMRWVGHVRRMDDTRLPKRLFYGELKLGKRPQHRPKKRFKDVIKSNLKLMGLDPVSWETIADDRNAWRNAVFKACVSFEKNRIENCKLKRALRKGITENIPLNLSQELTCDICGRITLSKAGLISHKRSHNINSVVSNHTCNVCGKVCKSSGGLKRHSSVHL